MKLDAWLTLKGLSQEAFAEMIDVTGQSVSGYRKGNHIPGRETMQRIVEATEGAVQPADFYS